MALQRGAKQIFAWRTSTFGQGTYDSSSSNMPDLNRRLQDLEREVKQLRQEMRERTFSKRQQDVVAFKVSVHVNWFNVKKGYGFIIRNDTRENVFVYRCGISQNNPAKLLPSVGDGELVEFDDILVPGRTLEAINVTGPNGTCVQGSIHSPERNSRFMYPAPVVHAAMRAYTENLRADPALIHDSASDELSNDNDHNKECTTELELNLVNSSCQDELESSAPDSVLESDHEHSDELLRVDTEEPEFQTVAVPDELVFDPISPVTDYIIHRFQEPGPDFYLPPSENLCILRT